MIVQWADAGVQAALIQSVGTVFAALVAALAAALIGRRIADHKRLQEKLVLSQQDVEFLLAVEEEHCALHQQHNGESNKLRVRQAVRNRGLLWSGKFTPGRAKDSKTLQQAKLVVAAKS